MRGIVFDIDDTLYCRQDMLVQAAENVLGVKVPDWREFIRIFYEKSDVNMAQLESGEVSTRDTNGWRYNETFRLLGLPYKPQDGGLAADAYLELQSHMFISDGLAAVLDKLVSDPSLKLAILTAGESKHQWNKVDMLGLDRWFDRASIIVTGDTPYTKPDVELFRMMETRLGFSPSDLWMIGDNYDKDIAGAIAAGWHSLWINRRGLPAPDALPDISVLNDDEFVSALTKEFT
ncbi:MAG: HAD family hydrolase [Clostridiales bacterium]|nr:HAD family hydrolase [Clostridiales bacterium]